VFKINQWLYAEDMAPKQLNIATTAMQCDRNPATNRKNLSAKIKFFISSIHSVIPARFRKDWLADRHSS
jgi:hypothetical protein